MLSQLFRGDPKLEAAAASDPAHIGPGAAGDHVRKIQLAVIQLDSARIAPDGRYGPATAAAVLAYKRLRNIVNRSYETQADDIVGKMTIESLDRELFARELPVEPPQCQFGATAAPQSRHAYEWSALVATLGPVPTPAQPRDEALAHRDDALNWVRAAIVFLRQIHGLAVMKRLNDTSKLKMDLSGIEGTEQVKALKVHFKFEQAPDTLKFLGELLQVYADIQKVLNSGDTFFTNDLVKNDFAYAYPGAFARADSDPLKKIFFCKPYLGKGPLFQTAVIVHEGSHFVRSQIGHVASELPKFDGTPVGSSHNYAVMTYDEAFQNAYSYAQFALHAFKKTDYRITPFNE
jgi:hypothetical protein